jgi:hypothetical protein
LANKLRKLDPYFDFFEYLKSALMNNRLKRGVEKNLNMMSEKIVSVATSPKKVIKKYSNKVINGKLRQPLRKVYYAIKPKKM